MLLLFVSMAKCSNMLRITILCSISPKAFCLQRRIPVKGQYWICYRNKKQKLGLFPVGRLDKDTTGLLLLTNDGTFAHRIISPKQHIAKRYLAKLMDV